MDPVDYTGCYSTRLPPCPLRSNQRCEIILLDDDEEDFFFLQKVFRTYSDQITLHHLTNPATLIESLQSAQTLPSLILLDMHMGGLDGFVAAGSMPLRGAYCGCLRDPQRRDALIAGD